MQRMFQATCRCRLIWYGSPVRQLKKWDLLDKVTQSGCPPIRTCLLDLGPLQLQGEPVPAGDVRDAYAPRRFILDRILLDAALEAGAELRQEFRVNEIIWAEDTAIGVRGSAAGNETAETARFIVGADGRNSRIAQLVQADRYDEVTPKQGTYFAYWRGLSLDRLEFHVRPGCGVYALPTNDGLTLVGVNWAIADFEPAKKAVERSYLDVLAACAPDLHAACVTGVRESNFVGGAIANVIRNLWVCL